MSRILFLQCFRPRTPGAVRPRFDHVVGVLSAMLRREGHETSLEAVTHFDGEHLFGRIEAAAPDLVHAVVDGTAADLARRALGAVAEKFAVPVVAGGQYATVMPSAALSMPGVQAVVVGEPEQAFSAYLAAHLAGQKDIVVPGVCTRPSGCNGRFRPAPPAPALDDLPFADRELFGVSEGDVEFEVVTSRGCPMRCAYCVNDVVRNLYEDPPTFVRRRSPNHICDEIDGICLAYSNARRIWFSDHPFAMDAAWLKSFSEVYAERCGMPFGCHVRANSLDEGRGDLLAAAGCDRAEVEIISGSNFIRNEVLEMDTTRAQIERTLTILHNRGIRSCVVSYVGVPYSSEITEQDTTKLLRLLEPDELDVRVYYPFPGTRAAEVAREMNWMSNRGEENYTAARSILDMPSLPARNIAKIARHMPAEVRSPGRSGIWRALGRIPVAPGKTLADLISMLSSTRA